MKFYALWLALIMILVFIIQVSFSGFTIILLFPFHLNVDRSSIADNVKHGRKLRQRLEFFQVLFIGLDFELDADVLIAFPNVLAKSKKAAYINVTFQFRFQFVDPDASNGRMTHQTCRQEGS